MAPSDIRSVMQQLRAERAVQAGADQRPLVEFINWDFEGEGSNIALFVTVVPLSEIMLNHATIALQTPAGVTLSNGVTEWGFPQSPRSVDLFTTSEAFDPSLHGTQVQAYAAVRGILDGQTRVQFSPVRTYTVD